MSYTQPALPTMSGTWWAIASASLWSCWALSTGTNARQAGVGSGKGGPSYRPTSGIDAKQSETGKEK